MKRLLTATLLVVLLSYGLPLLTLGVEPEEKQPEPQQEEARDGQAVQVSGQSYDEKTQVTVLTEGQVQTMPLSRYLRGVVAAAMPASFPPEALVGGLETDGKHVKVGRDMSTNLAGLFAAGDVTGTPYQFIKAAGEGLTAAYSAQAFLRKEKKS